MSTPAVSWGSKISFSLPLFSSFDSRLNPFSPSDSPDAEFQLSFLVKAFAQWAERATFAHLNLAFAPG